MAKSILQRNWMRNRNTIGYLGIWEGLYNPSFKPLEFEGFKKEAGLNAFTLLGYCAGIMLAASTLGLIVPAFEQTNLWRQV